MARNYEEYVRRKTHEYQEKANLDGVGFDSSDLSKQFIPYFESGQRIEVELSWGEKKRGRVGVTTGWKPVFLLMLTKRSIGSVYTLSDKDKVLRVVSE